MRMYSRFDLPLTGLLVCSVLVGTAMADDIAGSRDHPLLDRYPDSRITEYQRGYDAIEFPIAKADGEVEQRRIEGDTTVIRYFYNNAETQASPLQLLRNYQNAIKAIGGSLVYERLPVDGDGGETTMTVDANGKSFWIKVGQDIYGVPTQNYVLSIVEVAAMIQVVKANQLWDELDKNGFVTLYINFDTGKAELKADGEAAVVEIVALLKAQATLKISVEGHTDNVGSAESNKLLSQARAQSVVDAVIAGGVQGARLQARGYGQESPIADNRTDDGRAKNRRVELVKL
ncbi:MAG: OmpA family protein [Proteobacteria bacterium]|nr:OmpA family protein [Pseudomonadota bacterium]MDA0994816.1 OmpA family protein [Pseudomonadota bacterium]